ncbi:hypothetical protein [Dyella sp. C11]|uniref:hypothetical protein n=1 Tax=Dyella sp. C11 TaxID=2126991 RepID=UPI0013006508|nr:hypothetical protein [Dyella sp. C11]
MNIEGARLCMVMVAAMMIGARGDRVAREPSNHLEKTLGAWAGRPALPRPEDLAKALNIAISKPELASTYGYQSEGLSLTYRIGANPWGLTRMDFRVETDKGGVHAAHEELALSLDKSYCLKPANFPAEVGLSLAKMVMPIADSPSTYDVISYDSPAGRGTRLRIESASKDDCAKRVSLSIFYFSRDAGPTVATLIPAEISNRLPARPPFTAAEFWQTFMAMIRLHNGYIGPEELQQSLHVTFTPIAMGYKSTARRELRARDGWYFGLFYDVTGPGYQSVQPGVVPNGQSSALTISIPSFSFVDDAGQPGCLSASMVETGLLDAGWTPAAEKKALLGQAYSQAFKLDGKDSNLDFLANKLGDRYCVTSIRVAGAW